MLIGAFFTVLLQNDFQWLLNIRTLIKMELFAKMDLQMSTKDVENG